MKKVIIKKTLVVATSCVLLSSTAWAQDVDQIKPDQMKPIESGPAKSSQVGSDASTWDWVEKERLPKGTMHNKDYVPDLKDILGRDDGYVATHPQRDPRARELWQAPRCIFPPCPDDPPGSGDRPNT